MSYGEVVDPAGGGGSDTSCCSLTVVPTGRPPGGEGSPGAARAAGDGSGGGGGGRPRVPSPSVGVAASVAGNVAAMGTTVVVGGGGGSSGGRTWGQVGGAGGVTEGGSGRLGWPPLVGSPPSMSSQFARAPSRGDNLLYLFLSSFSGGGAYPATAPATATVTASAATVTATTVGATGGDLPSIPRVATTAAVAICEYLLGGTLSTVADVQHLLGDGSAASTVTVEECLLGGSRSDSVVVCRRLGRFSRRADGDDGGDSGGVNAVP
ncbi:hypothetical protein MMPV_006541 [Pyropia vietnamensis]